LQYYADTHAFLPPRHPGTPATLCFTCDRGYLSDVKDDKRKSRISLVLSVMTQKVMRSEFFYFQCGYQGSVPG
jgi:hypothetical protein